MDRITQSLLTEFSREHGIESLSEDKRFEHFASYLVVNKYHSDSFDTGDIVTGSGGDTGIDGIAIIANGTLVTEVGMVTELAETNGYLDVTFVFVQAERTSGFDTSKIGQFGFGVKDFFAESSTQVRNDMVANCVAVMAAIYERSSLFKRGKPACKLFYVTTGQWTGDQNLEARRVGVIQDLVASRLLKDVELIPVGASEIQNLYSQTRNAVAREFTFSSKTVIPEIPGVTEAYLGLLPATEFLKLIEDENGEMIKSIFYDNVRDWQDYNDVNGEIRTTLTSDILKKRFALMNNGVTVIAKTLRSTANRFFIEDYQIVNGCQTSHVLHGNKEHIDPSVMVPVRIISTPDEDITASVIKATNRQTEVREDQLMAISDFQKKLELFFKSFEEPARKLFYERRSRQYNNVTEIEKTRVITPANVIRAFASMFLDLPHSTTRNYQQLFEKVGTDIFKEEHRLEPYYAASFAYYRLEYFFRNQTFDAKYKPARFHIIMALRHILAPGNMPLFNSRDMKRLSESIFETLWDSTRAEQVFGQALIAVDAVASSNFHRDHIRTIGFTEGLKAHLAPR